MAAPVTLRRMLDAVRDPRYSKDSTGYGQVAHLVAGQRSELLTLWVAPTGSVTAPFVPYRIGVAGVPPEFGKHRYLTKGEARRYVTEDWQMQEATLFAGRRFKRLMYFTCDRPGEFLPEVTRALTAFEDRMIADRTYVEETATTLYEAGRPELARAGSRITRTRVQYGIRAPQTDEMSRLDYQMVTCRD